MLGLGLYLFVCVSVSPPVEILHNGFHISVGGTAGLRDLA